MKLILTLLLVLAPISAQGYTSYYNFFEPGTTITVQYIPSYRMVKSRTDNIEAAVNEWNCALKIAGANIRLKYAKEAPGFNIENGIVINFNHFDTKYAHTDTHSKKGVKHHSNISFTYSFSGAEEKFALMHEMGHSLGFGDDGLENTLMGRYFNTKVTNWEIGILAQQYGGTVDYTRCKLAGTFGGTSNTTPPPAPAPNPGTNPAPTDFTLDFKNFPNMAQVGKVAYLDVTTNAPDEFVVMVEVIRKAKKKDRIKKIFGTVKNGVARIEYKPKKKDMKFSDVVQVRARLQAKKKRHTHVYKAVGLQDLKLTN